MGAVVPSELIPRRRLGSPSPSSSQLPLLTLADVRGGHGSLVACAAAERDEAGGASVSGRRAPTPALRAASGPG